jgi:hypothetical protein
MFVLGGKDRFTSMATGDQLVGTMDTFLEGRCKTMPWDSYKDIHGANGPS